MYTAGAAILMYLWQPLGAVVVHRAQLVPEPTGAGSAAATAGGEQGEQEEEYEQQQQHGEERAGAAQEAGGQRGRRFCAHCDSESRATCASILTKSGRGLSVSTR